jgi:hypothetical protein
MIGFSFSPDYAYRSLSTSSNEETVKQIISSRNSYEAPRLGFTSGLNVAYLISPKWSIDLGVHFSRKGFVTNLSNLVSGDIIDPRKGFISSSSNTESPNALKIIYSINYLDLPVRAIYTFSKSKLNWQVGIGVCTSFSLYTTGYIISKYPTEKTYRRRQRYANYYEPIMVSPIVSVGAEYKISNKFILRAEPTFKYALNPVYDSNIEQRLWSAGLNLSCYYKFQ